MYLSSIRRENKRRRECEASPVEFASVLARLLTRNSAHAAWVSCVPRGWEFVVGRSMRTPPPARCFRGRSGQTRTGDPVDTQRATGIVSELPCGSEAAARATVRRRRPQPRLACLSAGVFQLLLWSKIRVRTTAETIDVYILLYVIYK